MDKKIAVGIDVSKGKSMVVVMNSDEEILMHTKEFYHNHDELNLLIAELKAITGEIRVVMEHTSTYYKPIASKLKKAGFSVNVVHAKLIHDFGNNSIRHGKTDKKDAIKIAKYTLAYWNNLGFINDDNEVRDTLRKLNRQLDLYIKNATAYKNNLINILDSTFPDLNKLFVCSTTKVNGHEKWVDFSKKYWHVECVTSLSLNAFTQSYQKWCKTNKSCFSEEKANEIYTHAKKQVATMSKNNATKSLIRIAISILNTTLEAILEVRNQMNTLASQLKEYEVVSQIFGVGDNMASRLIAEIGDITRFKNKRSLIAYAGLDSPQYQSGQTDLKERKISKRGSPYLRQALFIVVKIINMQKPENNDIYDFICKKKSEGKHFLVCLTAACNKLLRIYYGKAKEHYREQSCI